MSASIYIIRQQVRHVLETEDAALAAARNMDEDAFIRAMCMRRATLHNALRAIADMLDGIEREPQE